VSVRERHDLGEFIRNGWSLGHTSTIPASGISQAHLAHKRYLRDTSYMNTSNNTLAGQHIVIVGGSSGIGLAAAQRLNRRGAQVTIAGRDVTRLEAARGSIGTNVNLAQVEVTNEKNVEAFFEKLGPLDHLVTTAGGKATDGPIAQVTTEAARALFDVKYWGQYFCVKHSQQTIRPGGSITLFSAWLARKPTAGFPTYAAIDGAIESLARVAMLERAPLRVNVVSPGVIDTPLFDNLDEATRTATFESVAGRLPLQRVGNPDDVARAVEYVITNPYSNGAVVDVDGGWA
jgi:NAD(P)-dependent dehydrogenase (short-subunit alcohol dehydrogenase family)